MAAPRFYARADILKVVPRSYPTIWQWMREGRFPLGRQMGDKTVWFADEVDDWLRDLPVRKYKPIAKKTKKRAP